MSNRSFSDATPAVNRQSTSAMDRRFGLRVSAAGFLAALVLMLVATPFVDGLKHGRLYERMLFTGVMYTGLIAIGSRQRLAFALVTSALAAVWLNQLWPRVYPALTFILPEMAFLVVVTAFLLRYVLRAKKVDGEVLCVGISIYLILGLLWGLAYTLVAQVSPTAFSFSKTSEAAATMNGFTSIYFSFTTLATLGYGDITPATNVARMLAMIEAMTGTLFVSVMIARLVSLYSSAGQSEIPNDHRGETN